MDESNPSPDDGWDTRHQFYSTIGQGISLWTKMETALVGIFSELIGVRYEKGGLILYSIMNFNTWLVLITELYAVDQRYSDLSKRWNKKFERLRALNDIRTRLAHHTVWQGEDDLPMLIAGRFDIRPKSKAHLPLAHVDILEFNQSVLDIFRELVALLKETVPIARAASQRKSAKPEADPPS
jgi:hypothetical protein